MFIIYSQNKNQWVISCFDAQNRNSVADSFITVKVDGPLSARKVTPSSILCPSGRREWYSFWRYVKNVLSAKILLVFLQHCRIDFCA